MVPEVHWTDIDGVAVAWTEGRAPLTAGLLFRTGLVDEYLYTSGLTHLIEHLALSAVPDSFMRRNGFVAGLVTGFVMKGSAEEVSAFVRNVCRALMSLPADRLEAEKQVLSAEASNRRYDPTGHLLTWRYGAVGWGLSGLPTVGYRSATLDQLQHYVTQRFTRDNAVLWLSGPPPSDLRLDLPHGRKLEVPPLAPLLPEYPAWIVDDHCGGVGLGGTVARGAPCTVFASLATSRLHDHLRRDLAVSYAPAVGYEALDAHTAHILLYADSDVERRAELAEGFAEVVNGLNHISEDEVATECGEILEAWVGSLAPPPEERALREVQRAAMDWIFGRESRSMEALADELRSVRAADVMKNVSALRDSALYALPTGTKLQDQMGAPAPPCLVPRVYGRRVVSVDAPLRKEKLIVGRDGITALASGGWEALTVRYANLSAALSYEDGGLQLISTDGASLRIEPTLWRRGKALCAEIRRHVPAYLLLDQGTRPVDAIPGPATTRGQRFFAHMPMLRTALAMLAVIAGCLALVLGVLFVTEDENLAGNVFMVYAFSIAGGGMAWLEVSKWRRRRATTRDEE